MVKKRKQKNYMDFIPEKKSNLVWYQEESGLVVLEMEHKGIFHLLAQKLLKKPKTTKIHMDEYGSYVWTLIDGKKTVFEVAELHREQFGENVEPLYERIVSFFRMMEGYGFITLAQSK